MDVNYHTQVQPNHTMFAGIDSDRLGKNGGATINVPNKVDKVNQGVFDRSMEKNGSENSQNQQGMQQLVERLTPLIAKFLQEILEGEQKYQSSSVPNDKNLSQGSEVMGDPMQASSSDQQSLSPQDQMIQQILERLFPYIEQMIQEMMNSDSSSLLSNTTVPQGKEEIQSEAVSNNQLQGELNQIVQQVMQILVPMIAQVVESIVGQSNQPI